MYRLIEKLGFPRLELLTVGSLSLLLVTTSASQIRVGNTSSVSALIGYSWFSPQTGSRFQQQPEKFNSFSGVAFSFRAILKTPSIWNKLGLGAEYGIHGLAGEKSTLMIIVDTGYPTVNNVNAYYFHVLADVQVLRLSLLETHIMLGAGVVDDDETRILRGGWLGRVVGSVPLFWDEAGNIGMSFDVEMTSVNSFNGMKLGTVGLLGGLSFRW